MSRAAQGNISLTGVWQGRYTYNGGPQPVEFVATLIESGSHIGGTTHEPGGAIGKPGQSAHGVLSGSREGAHVLFTKTYENGHEHAIEYDGMVNPEATEITGNWIIFGEWGGSFQMIRAGGNKAERARRKTVEVR